MNSRHEILVAEDDELDVILLERDFKDVLATTSLTFVRDGQEAIDWLERRGADPAADTLPALTLLDLKMPRRDGLETLEWIRSRPGFRCMPVIMFSSSGHRDDIERAYSLGANAYLVKPSSTLERAAIARFVHEWVTLVQRPLATTEGLAAAHAWQALKKWPMSGSA